MACLLQKGTAACETTRGRHATESSTIPGGWIVDLRPTNSISLHRGLHLTTELKQGISVLQMSATDLVDYVEQCVEENPFLDDDDWREPTHPFEVDRYRRDVSSDALFERRGHGSPENFDSERADTSQRSFSFDRFLVDETTLEDYLTEQFDMLVDDKRLRAVGEYLIGCIDGDGYLRTPIPAIAASLEADEGEVEAALGLIQRLEPAGVGARCLAECLSIQLEAEQAMSPLLREILDEHLEEFATRSPSAVARDLGVTLVEVTEALDAIRACNPHPAAQFGRSSQPVWPEVVVERAEGGGFSVRMLDIYLPHLRINEHYRTLAREASGSGESARYLKEKLAEAEGILDSLQYRKATLYKVSCCIAELQAEFFDEGFERLRPLTMASVAEMVGVSESTVSRVANGNYMQTPQGMFELKFFFHSAVGGERGDAVSSTGVKRRIVDLVEGEDRTRPLSDQAIADELAKQGVRISRRTVNKYREELGIPAKSARRR